MPGSRHVSTRRRLPIFFFKGCPRPDDLADLTSGTASFFPASPDESEYQIQDGTSEEDTDCDLLPEYVHQYPSQVNRL